MKVNNKESIFINGKTYWTIQQFSDLTEKSVSTIRVLMHKGNRIRKLKFITIGNKPFIEYDELFEFPFVIKGRPGNMGPYVEKFYLKKGELVKNEEVYEIVEGIDE